MSELLATLRRSKKGMTNKQLSMATQINVVLVSGLMGVYRKRKLVTKRNNRWYLKIKK